MNLPNFRSVAGCVAAVSAVAATIALAPGIVGSFPNAQRTQFVTGIMPACDTKLVRDLLIRAVHKSPRARQGGLRIIELGDVEDYAKNAAPRTDSASIDIRFCQAVAFTNAGQGDLHFILKWLNAKKDQLWLEITVSTI